MLGQCVPEGTLIGLDDFCWCSYHYILDVGVQLGFPKYLLKGRQGGREEGNEGGGGK